MTEKSLVVQVGRSASDLEIRKQKGGWIVLVRGAPVVRLNGKLWFDRALAGVPGGEGQPPIPVGTKPHRFKTKSDAESIAGQIGRYMLNRGPFLYAYTTYTEEKKDGSIVVTRKAGYHG